MLRYEQTISVGLKYIFDKLSPSSAPGAELCRNADFYPPARRAELEAELNNVERAVALYRGDRRRFTDLKIRLSHVKELSETFRRLSGAVPSEVELFEIKNFLIACEGVAEEFAAASEYGISGIVFKKTDEAKALLSKGQEVGGFYISDAYSEKLAEARRKKRRLESLLARGEEREKHKKEHLSLAAEEEREEAAVRAELGVALAPFVADFIANTEAAAKLDFILAKAELAVATGAIRPVIGDKIDFRGMFNPAVAERLGENGRKFTPLDFEAERGATVITGANMGGKSVALKTIALNLALAASGFFVYAASAEFFVPDFIDIVSENLQSTERGLSSFGGEAVRADRLYAAAKQGRGVALLDEFAGGTNAEEGAAIFAAAVKAFGRTDSVAIMTTHFDGVAKFASAHYRVVGLKDTLPEKAADKERAAYSLGDYMDYGLRRISGDAAVPRDAVRICRYLGMSEDILSEIALASDEKKPSRGKK